MSTYSQDGTKIDEISGTSFRITRDKTFDSTDSEGISNNDSNVLLIPVGNNHVGSTMVMEENGLENIMDTVEAQVSLENNDPGTPWLNDMRHNYQNMWAGKAKTLIIRSQYGFPVATYTGDNVEIFSTDFPKSTWFQVDGKMLFVYRADYTVYDNDLLQ